MNESFALFFPQWQGSSLTDGRGLYSGAWRLRELFPDHDFMEIAVHPEAKSTAREGVLAHADLLKHLRQAQKSLDNIQLERMLTLGGDCSVDIATVAYLNARHENLAVLWLDAHADLNTPETTPSGALHGMVLRLLLGEGDGALLDFVATPLEPRQVFLLGARDFDPPEREYIEAKQLQHFAVSELEATAEKLVAALKAGGFTKLHLHFDLDVLDPALFSATGYPTEGGLGLTGVARLLSLLASSFAFVGLTLTEYLPQEGRETDEREVLHSLLEALPKL